MTTSIRPKTKSKRGDVNKPKEIKFKNAMARLTEITNIIEDGECELEDMIILYEEGISLVQTCQAKLDSARLKISQINNTENKNNKPEEVV